MNILQPEVFPYSSVEVLRAEDVDKPYRLRLRFPSGNVQVWAFATEIARSVAHAGLVGLPVTVEVEAAPVRRYDDDLQNNATCLDCGIDFSKADDDPGLALCDPCSDRHDAHTAALELRLAAQRVA